MSILVRLIYASQVAPNFGPMDMRDILERSRRNNQLSHITGLLVMCEGHFFQCLEGERPAVNATYARILRDPRHTGSCVISTLEISRRLFPGWTMGYVLSVEKNRALFMAYAADDHFEPLNLRADAAEQLLADIAAHTRQLVGKDGDGS